jgi:hypothetical protein
MYLIYWGHGKESRELITTHPSQRYAPHNNVLPIYFPRVV